MSSFDGLLDRQVRGLFTPFSPSSCAAASVAASNFWQNRLVNCLKAAGHCKLARMQPGQIVDLTTGSQEVTL